MSLEQWSDTIALVRLADDPQFTEDLLEFDPHSAKAGRHLVLDFATVTFINSSNLARLLKLRKQLITADRRLILCQIHDSIVNTFRLTGLDNVFEFTENVPTALALLQVADKRRER
jgi:anti-anti-sigma factor